MLIEMGLLLAGAVAVAGTVVATPTSEDEIGAILGEFRKNGRVRKAEVRHEKAMRRGEAWHNRTAELSRKGALLQVSTRVPPEIDDEAKKSKDHLHFIRVKEWRATEPVLAPAPRPSEEEDRRRVRGACCVDGQLRAHRAANCRGGTGRGRRGPN